MREAKGAKARYKTPNWAAYNGALKARGSLSIWLDKDMQWYAPASGKRGRQQVLSDAAIQFCLSIKCLFGLALRQSLGLLVDSTGIKFLGEGEWKRKKHGAEYRRQWRKVHLGIDANTLQIRAIEVTDNSVGDAPMLPELLSQIAPDEALASVSGDGAYDTKACHAAIVQRGAQAVIPPRKNAQAWKASLGGSAGAQRGAQSLPPPGLAHLEDVERLPPSKSGGDQDVLLQAPGRAGDGAHV